MTQAELRALVVAGDKLGWQGTPAASSPILLPTCCRWTSVGVQKKSVVLFGSSFVCGKFCNMNWLIQINTRSQYVVPMKFSSVFKLHFRIAIPNHFLPIFQTRGLHVHFVQPRISPETGTGEHLLTEVNLMSRKVLSGFKNGTPNNQKGKIN